MEDNYIDLTPFNSDNLYYSKGYDGFISQDGIFYKTGKRSNFEAIHDVYAETLVKKIYDEKIYDKYESFIRRNPEYKNLVFGAKDILINFYGFTNFQKLGSILDITAPNPKFNSFSLTDKQILLIEKLLILNGDNYDEIFQVFKNKYDNYDLFMNKAKILKKPS